MSKGLSALTLIGLVVFGLSPSVAVSQHCGVGAPPFVGPEPEVPSWHYELPVTDTAEPAEPIFPGARGGNRPGGFPGQPPAPGGGAGAPGGGFGGPGGGGGGPKKGKSGDADVSWTLWWQENRADYLGRLLAEITKELDTTNSDIDLGEKKTDASDALRLNRRRAQEEIYPKLINLLKDDQAVIRAGAVLALGKSGDPTVAAEVMSCLNDKDAGVRQATCMALAFLETKEHVTLLRGILENKPAQAARMNRSMGILFRTRSMAALSLGVIAQREKSREAFSALMEFHKLPKTPRDIRLATIVALGLSEFSEANTPLVKLLRDTEKPAEERARAAAALGRLKSRAAVPLLAQALEGKNRELARSAAIALGHICKPVDSRGVDALRRSARASADLGISLRSTIALGRIGGAKSRETLMKQLRAKASERAAFAALALGLYSRDGASEEDVAKVGAELLKRYKKMRTGPQRGAFAIALGLCGYQESLGYLRKQLSSRAPLRYRVDVSSALALLGDTKSVDAARRLIAAKSDMRLRIEATMTMVAYGARDTEDWLREQASSRNRNLQTAALYGLGILGKLNSGDELVKALGKKKVPAILRRAATYALGNLADYRPRPIWSSISDGGLATISGGAINQFLSSL